MLEKRDYQFRMNNNIEMTDADINTNGGDAYPVNQVAQSKRDSGLAAGPQVGRRIRKREWARNNRALSPAE